MDRRLRYVYIYEDPTGIMVPNTAPASKSCVDHEVMMAEDSGDVIIADICRDGAWLSMPVGDALALADWQ